MKVSGESSARSADNKSENSQVRNTGDWSSDSKLSCISNGYWEDPFFTMFNKNSVPKRTSLICKGYFVRHKVCDYFLRKIIALFECPVQIVSLGCGMDTTYFRLLPEFDEKLSRYFDVDFETVIQEKGKVISNEPVLSSMAEGKLVLVPADLRDIPKFHEALSNLNFDFGAPTIFYSECVVNYLKPSESDGVLYWIARNVGRSVWFAYEQCYPGDPYGRLMMEHFAANGCPLLSLREYPDPVTQEWQLDSSGFDDSFVINARDAFEFLSRGTELLYPTASNHQFDEYEALMATCLHYTLRLGLKGIKEDPNISRLLTTIEENFERPQRLAANKNLIPTRTLQTNARLSLSAHAAVPTSKDSIRIFTVGGVGSNSVRSSDLQEWELKEESFESSVIGNNGLFERVHASLTFVPSNDKLYLFGGRKSPANPCTDDLVSVSIETGQPELIILTTSKKPSLRWRHGIVTYTYNETPFLFLYGGTNGKDTLGDLWIYNIKDNEWEELSVRPPARHSHSMCVDESSGLVYLVGGMDGGGRLVEDALWAYDYKSTNAWSLLPSNSLTARTGHSVFIFQTDFLLLVGGYGSTGDHLDNFVALINPKNPSVSRSFSISTGHHLFLPFGFGAFHRDEELILFGGGGNCFSFGTHSNDVALLLRLSDVDPQETEEILDPTVT